MEKQQPLQSNKVQAIQEPLMANLPHGYESWTAMIHAHYIPFNLKKMTSFTRMFHVHHLRSLV